jgi:Uma2 family endonuclease
MCHARRSGPATKLIWSLISFTFPRRPKLASILSIGLRADLVIEVISPGSAIYDRNTKADTYAALGVKELWLVDETKETVEARTLRGDRYGEGKSFAKGDQLTSTVIAAMTIAVIKIFED